MKAMFFRASAKINSACILGFICVHVCCVMDCLDFFRTFCNTMINNNNNRKVPITIIL